MSPSEFNVSSSLLSSPQLNQVAEDPLKRPVVYVKGNDAVKLMNIVNKQKVARARIQHRPPRVSGHATTPNHSVQMTCVCDTNLRHMWGKWRRGEHVSEAQAPNSVETFFFFLDVKTSKNSICEIWPFSLSSLISAAPRPRTFSQHSGRLISAIQRAVCLLEIFDKRPAHFEVKWLDIMKAREKGLSY